TSPAPHVEQESAGQFPAAQRPHDIATRHTHVPFADARIIAPVPGLDKRSDDAAWARCPTLLLSQGVHPKVVQECRPYDDRGDDGRLLPCAAEKLERLLEETG
ncbi:MAG: hypothetical protein ACTHMP_12170, partial [Thermomicrobiales bacterium]